MHLIWLVPLIPAAGALANGLLGIRAFSKRTAGAIACTAMIAALAVSMFAFWQLIQLPADDRSYSVVLAEWIPSIPVTSGAGAHVAFGATWGFRLDPLSALMLLVVTGVGTVIHVYSVAYMHGETRPAFARYFCYLNLFCAFMLLLVLGSNALVMFAGWEGVGFCSYLLVGYWYERTTAADAGRKAFVVNRVGDWAFILGIVLLFWTFGTLDFAAVQHAAASMPIEHGHFGRLSAIALLLFIGAMAKSAQLPLHVWLPDAMEGPTPVSALIHAATMVTAGVYMLGRNSVLFAHAPVVLTLVMAVGIVTAVVGASIAMLQYDIKRLLAYSTMSQLGLMFVAVGVGAPSAGVFHLMTHACFKALLFLAAGSIIHAMAGEQDLRNFGNLRRSLPITFAAMAVGGLAIAGVPPLAGFFSKDQILEHAFETNRLVWFLGVATSLMTAFYMARLVAMTFFDTKQHRVPHDVEASEPVPVDEDEPADAHHVHELPAAMTAALVLLAAGAVIAGFVGVPSALGGANRIETFLEPSLGVGTAEHHASLGRMILLVFVAAAGIAFAWRAYVFSPLVGEHLAVRYEELRRVIRRGYLIDDLYDVTFAAGITQAANRLWRFDSRVVDGLVNGSSWATRIASWMSGLADRGIVDGAVNAIGARLQRASFGVRRLQTGLVQNYALMTMLGIFVFVSVYLFLR